jgi:hypothetical protein
MDQIEVPCENQNNDPKLPIHSNVRGPAYYIQTATLSLHQ